MKKAAVAQEYERAADLRDLLSNLRRTTKKVNHFERLPYSLPLAVDPARELVELGQALGLPGPPERIEGFDISNISGTFKVASLVSFRNGRPDRSNYRRFRIKTVEGQDDFASVAEVVRRRYTRVLNEAKAAAAPESGRGESVAAAEPGQPVASELQRTVDDVSRVHQRPGQPTQSTDAVAADLQVNRAPGPLQKRGALPDLILIDGGKGQLSAACAELEKLGLRDIPVIGLAKEFEEIYRPGEKQPLRLSHESGALKLLQRVRDE